MSENTFEQLCAQFGYRPRGRLITGQELAAWLAVHPATVEGWRHNGSGPKYLKPPQQRRVWYAERDVLSWLASGERRNTSEAIDG
jgi:hypothetical protein